MITSKKNLKSYLSIIGAIGVVYGDIGTSPLYAINEIFFSLKKQNLLSELTILGSISLVIWSITLIICLKYLGIVVLADHDGEGGVFALYSRLHHFKNRSIHILKILLMLAAGLLIGESIITPAISVLSSIEGVAILNENLSNKITTISIFVLFSLFIIQSRGTNTIGKFFGPIATIWFLMLGILGLVQIYEAPLILKSFNPYYAFLVLKNLSLIQIFVLLSSIMLVITGGEALFADMGHFGKGIIRKGWFILVYPALIINYLGQGAFLLKGSEIINQNIFFSMVPRSFLLPAIIISTLATIIASQALITGAFSLASQAVALGLFPRIKINQTHHEHVGQIYVGPVNWFLCFSSIALVLIFKNSNALAAAYGLSVSGVMIITTLSMFGISSLVWKWNYSKILLILLPILILEFCFLVSNMTKFFEGGFIPLVIGLLIFMIMRIWRWGRKATFKGYSSLDVITIQELITLKESSSNFIDKNVVLLVPKPLRSIQDKSPALVQLFYNRYGLLPKNLYLVEVVHRKVPFIHQMRHETYLFYNDPIKGVIASTTLHFGFMEEPNVELALAELAKDHQLSLPKDPNTWLVHVAKEKLIPNKKQNIFEKIRFNVFSFLRQVTQSAHYYYGLGNEVNLSVDIIPVKIEDIT